MLKLSIVKITGATVDIAKVTMFQYEAAMLMSAHAHVSRHYFNQIAGATFCWHQTWVLRCKQFDDECSATESCQLKHASTSTHVQCAS